MTIGSVQPGTSRRTFLLTIGSRKTTPPRILRTGPFGDLQILLRLKSSPRHCSDERVAQLKTTPTSCMALEASNVNLTSVRSRSSTLRLYYFWVTSNNHASAL